LCGEREEEVTFMKAITNDYMQEIAKITKQKLMKRSRESVEWRYDFLKVLGTFSQKRAISKDFREIVY
jgi:transposase